LTARTLRSILNYLGFSLFAAVLATPFDRRFDRAIRTPTMTPIKLQLARFVKRTAHNLGWEIRRSTSSIGEYEPFLARLKQLGFRPQRILDVGAHQADWAETTSSFFPEATFVLVEPQADLAPRLKAFCDRSPGSRYVVSARGRKRGLGATPRADRHDRLAVS
jgi:hypothetical protein